jgi:hypothetical protein
MIHKDNRTPEQHETHSYGVIATDLAMSGWGEAKNGLSCCAWAFPNTWTPDKIAALLKRIKGREEMDNVVVDHLDSYQVPEDCVHFHIYVEREN